MIVFPIAVSLCACRHSNGDVIFFVSLSDSPDTNHRVSSHHPYLDLVRPAEAMNLIDTDGLREVPSGLVESNSISPSKPTAFLTNSESSRMVNSLPVPTLIWQLRISPRDGMAPPLPSKLVSTQIRAYPFV